jgi:hypothetical protein
MGLLLSCFDYSPVAEEEFHDWYDTEHIPERQRVPGFVDCQRWLAADRPKSSIATYDLAAVDVLRSPGYLAIGYENNSPWTRRVGWRCIKLLRFEGEQIAPGDELPPRSPAALLVWAFNLEGASEVALIDWFQSEQRPRTSKVPGIRSARLFRATAGTHRYVALYHLSSADAPNSDEWQRYMEEPWTQRFGAHERDRFRMLAERYVRKS